MSVRAEKKAALAELLRLGGQMCNACFNLSQRTVVDLAREEETGSRWTNTRESLADLQRRWDNAIQVYRELSRPREKARARAVDGARRRFHQPAISVEK